MTSHSTAPALEKIIGEAWREVLEEDPPATGENFFECGGNSILLVHFQHKLSAELGCAVQLREIFDRPTVEGIRDRLAARDDIAAALAGSSGTQPLKLFCLPYAGASGRIYESWKDRLAPAVEIRPLELPGRGSRCMDAPIAELPALLDDLVRVMEPERAGPYAVFGHSFGAIVAYELVKHLEAGPFPGPRALVVSGSRAPHQATPARSIHDRSDAEFREGLRRVGGTPRELLENDELMELYLPVIRADYTILDLYRARDTDRMVDCGILALHGSEDPDADEADCGRWAEYTKKHCALRQVPGGHFFLHSAAEAVQDHLLEFLGSEKSLATFLERS